MRMRSVRQDGQLTAGMNESRSFSHTEECPLVGCFDQLAENNGQ